jgi:hypothetical protein
MKREVISKLIYQKIKDNQLELKQQFLASKNKIGFFFLDELLPAEIALEIPKFRQNCSEG